MREAGSSASPSTKRCRLPAIAAGLVVSRGSPGANRLSSGSWRAQRVSASPCARRKAVSPAGPPTSGSSRLAAALSLMVSVARHRSRTLMSLPTWRVLAGEWWRMSAARTGTRRSSDSSPRPARCSTAAASRNLKVLHIGKRSSMRWPKRAPLAGCHRQTPSRPPLRFSSAAKSSVAADADAGVRASAGRTMAVAKVPALNFRNWRRANMRVLLGGLGLRRLLAAGALRTSANFHRQSLNFSMSVTPGCDTFPKIWWQHPSPILMTPA